MSMVDDWSGAAHRYCTSHQPVQQRNETAERTMLAQDDCEQGRGLVTAARMVQNRSDAPSGTFSAHWGGLFPFKAFQQCGGFNLPVRIPDVLSSNRDSR